VADLAATVRGIASVGAAQRLSAALKSCKF